MKICLTLLMVIVFVPLGFSYPDYTGYAGSPVSYGSCAFTCHGPSNSFVPTVAGWPSAYNPGQSYTITLSHSGNQISNFNGCVLRQSNNSPVGQLQAGANTATYTHSGEGTAIHGSVDDQTSYTFSWVAPSPGVGAAVLYVTLHEGSVDGPNGGGTFVSGEYGIEETNTVTINDLSFNLLNSNPTNNAVKIELKVNRPSHLKLTVYDVAGDMVEAPLDQYVTGNRIIIWKPKVSSGIYFLKLTSDNNATEVKKVIIVK